MKGKWYKMMQGCSKEPPSYIRAGPVLLPALHAHFCMLTVSLLMPCVGG